MSDVNTLGLSAKNAAEIQKVIKENKMDWEPWLESAKDFASLKRNLSKRGYKGLPISNKPEIYYSTMKLKNVDKLPNQRIMMKRGES